MGIVFTSFDRALPAPPFRLRRATIPPHDPSGPFADHPCVRLTRLLDNDSVTWQRKSSSPGMWASVSFRNCTHPVQRPSRRHHMSVYVTEDDQVSVCHTVT